MNNLAVVDRHEESLTLVRYEAMCTAIAECHRVDEATNIRDKARALQVYYQQANNTEAERKALDIRLRAERRAGELLKELARMDVAERTSLGGTEGGRGRADSFVPHADVAIERPQSEYARTLDDLGMSRQKAHRFQQLAAVPEATFEAALADPVRNASAAAIVREAAAPVTPIDPDALRLWGKLRDFERQHDGKCDPERMFDLMTETMQKDTRRLLPQFIQYWSDFYEVVK